MLDPKEHSLRVRLLHIFNLLPTGVVIGVFVGALMNAINGWISPHYFQGIFPGWPDVDESIWLMSIGHGVLEGVVFGFVLSLVLMVGISLISKLRCPFSSSFFVQAKIVVFSLLFWLIGGFNGVLLAYLSPDAFGSFVRYHSGATPEILRIGWVAGSIWGVYVGSILSTIGALTSFSRKWKQLEQQTQI